MDTLPESLYAFLIMAGGVADDFGYGPTSSGCVRDILRREENLDIDIVIEGDGIAFAKKLGENSAPKLRSTRPSGPLW